MAESEKAPLHYDHEDMRKLYLSNLKIEVTKEDISAWLKENLTDITDAKIESVDLPEPREGSRIKIGFVLMDSHASVDDVLVQMKAKPDKQKELKGNTLNVKRAVPSSRKDNSFKERTKRMFIANIQKKGDIQAELEKFIYEHAPYLNDGALGKIEKFQLVKEKETEGSEVKEKKEENKGYGFLQCETEDLADKLAIQFYEFSWSALDAKKEVVQLKKSLPKEARAGGGRGRGRGRGGYAQAPGWYGPQAYGGYGYGGGYGGAYPPSTYGQFGGGGYGGAYW